MSSPKNCINLSLATLVLLLKKARVSLMPWYTRATIDIDMTVDPELYSTMVFVFPGTTPFSRRLRAELEDFISFAC